MEFTEVPPSIRPTLNVVYPRATQHLAKVRVFAEFAAQLLRGYEARLRRAPDAAD